MQNRFEIITVTFNNDNALKKTAKSIINQKNSKIIWTIIDGNNSKLVQKLSSQNFCNIRVFRDEGLGIYNAMNLGLFKASGEYLMFLNAGDTIENEWKTSDFFEKINFNEIDVLLMGYKVNEKSFKPNSFKYFTYKMPTSHQAIIFKKKIHKIFFYDTKYLLSADFDLLHRLKKSGYKFKTDNTVVVSIEPGGVSDLQRSLVYSERLQIMENLSWQKFFVLFSYLYCIPPFLRKLYYRKKK